MSPAVEMRRECVLSRFAQVSKHDLMTEPYEIGNGIPSCTNMLLWTVFAEAG